MRGREYSNNEKQIASQSLPLKEIQRQLAEAGYDRTVGSIGAWRNNNGFRYEKKSKPIPACDLTGGVSYRDALSQNKHPKMEHFLRCLATYNRKARELGEKINLVKFINAYANEYGSGGTLSERFKLTEYRKSQILQLYRNGMNYSNIAVNTGLCPDRVRRFLVSVES